MYRRKNEITIDTYMLASHAFYLSDTYLYVLGYSHYYVDIISSLNASNQIHSS